MKKRILALALSAAMALSLAACSGGGDASGSGSGSGSGSNSGETKKVGLSMPTQSLERWNRDGSYLDEQFKSAGYETIITYSDNDTNRQVSDIQNMIAEGVDLLVVAAIDGEAVPYAFLLKMLFTALTLGAGFKGGEIVPIFFTGATFGCVAAPLLGLPPQLGAALGMVALFCGCTNSPLASICLAIEVFGGQCVSLFALACAVSYMLSSYFSLYREQHFLHSKLRIVGVQRVHGHWSETDAAHLTTNGDGEN